MKFATMIAVLVAVIAAAETPPPDQSEKVDCVSVSVGQKRA